MTQSKLALNVQTFSKEDIPGLIELSSSVGWDYDEAEINTIMSVGTIFGHKTEQGKIVSSAAIIPYDNQLASIGMVIVKDDFRGYGLGKELTEVCVGAVGTNVAIMLIATEDGYPLYKKLGFQTVTCVHKFLLNNCATFLPVPYSKEYEVLPLTDNDFVQIRKLDQKAIGADREKFLKARINQAKQGVVVKGKNGNVVGYGLSIKGPINLILGPIVAVNHDVAVVIIHHLTNEYKGNLRIDVPDGQDSFLAYLKQCGFQKVSQPPVMVKNSTKLPERNHALYGIAAQIFG